MNSTHTPGVKQKLPVSLAVASLFALTLFFFGPVFFYLPNSGSFHFMFGDVPLKFFPVALVVTLITALVLFLAPVKFKIYQTLIVLTIWGSVCLWFQGNVILRDYGVLDGRDIFWGEQYHRGIVDGLIWAVLLAAVLVKAKTIYKYAKKIAVFFIVIQVLYTGVLLFQFPDSLKSKHFLQLDDSQQFGYSSKRNVIVMILDGFQTDLFQEIIDEEPEYGKLFEGFTYFRNSLSGFPLTQPSIPFILTGARFDNSMPFDEFVQEAYFSNSSIPRVLMEKGYKVEILMDCGRCVVKDKALLSNVKEETMPLSDSQAGYLFDLTLFKYLPHFLKPVIFNDNHWRFINYLREDSPPKIKTLAKQINPATGKPFSKQALKQLFDVRFIAGMLDQCGILTSKDTFKFYHLKGVHAPFRMDENLEYREMEIERENWKRLAKGNLKLAGIFLSHLKQKQLFDHSMIFIIADHGHSGGFYRVNDAPSSVKRPAVKVPASERVSERKIAAGLPLILVKPFGESSAMKISDCPVALSDIPHTVFTALGIEGEFVGEDMFSIENEAVRPRYFSYFQYKQGKAGGKSFPEMKHYRVSGHSWLVDSWQRWEKEKSAEK